MHHQHEQDSKCRRGHREEVGGQESRVSYLPAESDTACSATTPTGRPEPRAWRLRPHLETARHRPSLPTGRQPLDQVCERSPSPAGAHHANFALGIGTRFVIDPCQVVGLFERLLNRDEGTPLQWTRRSSRLTREPHFLSIDLQAHKRLLRMLLSPCADEIPVPLRAHHDRISLSEDHWGGFSVGVGS
jgi:hypothetical protein